MPKCPKCGEDVDYLYCFSKAEQKFMFTVDSEGHPDFELLDTYDLNEGEEYECPKCGEVLFTNEEDAINFLLSKSNEES